MISVKAAGMRFSDQWLFRGVEFEIPRGSSLALVGPSGSGKSVLLKLVAGLLSPEEGEIRVDSSNVGMLFQKNALFDSLSVEENLQFPLREVLGITGREAVRRSHALLEQVGLSGTESQYPSSLSGGMQKRLGIARALIVEPEILLYDEPTAGLDPITSKKIAELIRSFQKERGTTLLVVTNDMQRAYQLGDRIALLAQGSLCLGGTPADVKQTRDPALRQFIYGQRKGPLT